MSADRNSCLCCSFLIIVNKIFESLCICSSISISSALPQVEIEDNLCLSCYHVFYHMFLSFVRSTLELSNGINISKYNKDQRHSFDRMVV